MSAGCSTLLSSSKRVNAAPIAKGLLTRQASGSARFIPRNLPAHPHKDTHRLCTGILLNRAPIVTAWPTPFERSFYKYQARIARALSNPFPYQFYFPPGSPHEVKFRREELRRDAMAFGREFQLRERREGRKYEKLIKALEEENMDAQAELKPVSRTHESDLTGDLTNLNRRSDRNLYLMLKGTHDWTPWRFPVGSVQPTEKLHEAAQRVMNETIGVDMDTWFVARKPISFMDQRHQIPVDGLRDEKVFFLKAHILAGQAQIKHPDTHGQFGWLTKQEIEERVEPEYWEKIKDMLSEL
ncbi:hypothetical protein AURDEDRAFT_81544 [Auricularia subglabra TFB-10046 SS5]|nr:hypothetical protein AURDEDRAFT_81544 [Auricularia subglabra TFB-10046 SS5]